MLRKLDPLDRCLLEKAVRGGDLRQLHGRLTDLLNEVRDATHRLDFGVDLVEEMQRRQDQRRTFRALTPVVFDATEATESLLAVLKRCRAFLGDQFD